MRIISDEQELLSSLGPRPTPDPGAPMTRICSCVVVDGVEKLDDHCRVHGDGTAVVSVSDTAYSFKHEIPDA